MFTFNMQKDPREAEIYSICKKGFKVPGQWWKTELKRKFPEIQNC